MAAGLDFAPPMDAGLSPSHVEDMEVDCDCGLDDGESLAPMDVDEPLLAGRAAAATSPLDDAIQMVGEAAEMTQVPTPDARELSAVPAAVAIVTAPTAEVASGEVGSAELDA
ncbi:hypothetical protein HKX48_002416 [Thoreauomyces humboldtii]|nr:hypothetical protein HKX48_002416 [Thoreauomyces humboldtii]